MKITKSLQQEGYLMMCPKKLENDHAYLEDERWDLQTGAHGDHFVLFPSTRIPI